MKLIITESQHNFLVEQSSMFDPEDEKLYPSSKPTKAQQKNREEYGYEGGIKNEPTDVSWEGFYNPKDKHTILTILQIGTAFIPFVGPFISSGIGLYDAKTYYDEGDKKTAGLIGMFSVIPGIGGLASKLGLTKWSAKALGQIGKKISLGQKLSPVEIQVANKVVQNNKLIQSEVQKLSKAAIAKNVVKKGAKFVGTKVAPYVGANFAYNKTYDKFIQDSRDLVDFTKINVNKISDANKQAALNTEF